MIKKFLKTGLRRLGYNVINHDRFGIDVETDLARFARQQPLRTIFDVGGNFGQTALHYVTKFPEATVFTFEPVPTSYTRLCQSTRHHPRIKSHNVAVGDTEGVAKLRIAPAAGSNSLLPSKATIGSIDVQIIKLDSFGVENHIDTIDLLKMDVEGFEIKVLRGAIRLLEQQKIRYIYAECVFAPDTVSPHTTFFELHQFLERYGYCFVNYYPESFALRIGCAMGNVLYALKSTLPDLVQGSIHNIL